MVDYCNDTSRQEKSLKDVKEKNPEYRKDWKEFISLIQYITTVTTYVLTELEKKNWTDEFKLLLKNIWERGPFSSEVDRVQYMIRKILNIDISK